MSTDEKNETLNGTASFVASLVVNVAIGLVLTSVFTIFRRRMPWCYDARRIDTVRNPGYKPGDAYLAAPPRQARGVLDWIPQTIFATDEDILRTAGVDALLTIRFFLYMMLYFVAVSLFTVAILLPVQYFGGNEMSGFNMLSLSNVKEESHRTVLNMLFAYMFTFGLFFTLYRLWVANVAAQARWLANEQFCGRRLTLLVEGLPSTYRSDADLLRFFQTLFSNGVSGATVLKVSTELRTLLAERDAAVRGLNHAQGARELDFKGGYARPQHSLKMCCPGDADKVDAVEHFTAKVKEIDGKIASVKAKALEIASVGFVTFSSASAASAASQVPIVSAFGKFAARWAPEPRDMYWDGVLMHPWRKWAASISMAILHFFLVFFWSIPVGFASSLTTLQSLGKALPFLESIADLNPAIKGFLEGFLPGLAMTIFMAILPIILAAMARVQGIESEAWIQMYVFKKYFVFQVFNFFLLTALASSVFKQMQEIIDSPTSIVTLLAESIPASANIFLSYVMLRAFLDNFLELSQVIRWVICFIMGFISSTPEEYVGKWNPDPFKYGKMIPEAILVFTIGICFSCIQPIVVLFVACFFASGYLVHKYMFTYINVTVFETGGAFWPLTFNRVMVGTLVAQLTLIGLLGLKKVPIEAAVLIPLPFITIGFWWYCDTYLTKKFENPSLADAVMTDKDRALLSTSDKAILVAGRPVAPIGDDILPFLLPEQYADCAQRDARLYREGADIVAADKQLRNMPETQTLIEAAMAGNADAIRARLNKPDKLYLRDALSAGGFDDDGEDDQDSATPPGTASPRALVPHGFADSSSSSLAVGAPGSAAPAADAMVSSTSVAAAVAAAAAAHNDSADAAAAPVTTPAGTSSLHAPLADTTLAVSSSEVRASLPGSMADSVATPVAGAAAPVALSSEEGHDGAGAAAVQSVLSGPDAGVARARLQQLRADYARAAAAVAAQEAALGGASAATPRSKDGKPARKSRLTPSGVIFGGAIGGADDDEKMMARLALMRYVQPELAVHRFGVRVQARVWPPAYLEIQRSEYNNTSRKPDAPEALPFEDVVPAAERLRDARAHDEADATGTALRPAGTDTDLSEAGAAAAEAVPGPLAGDSADADAAVAAAAAPAAAATPEEEKEGTESGTPAAHASVSAGAGAGAGAAAVEGNPTFAAAAAPAPAPAAARRSDDESESIEMQPQGRSAASAASASSAADAAAAPATPIAVAGALDFNSGGDAVERGGVGEGHESV